MARIILVHGAWGNALNWVAITPALRDAGHEVVALDLPGHGAHPPSGAIGQAEYVAAVGEVLAKGGPAMLVGHSMGGIVVAQAAARWPDSVAKAVFVAALLPRDGESLLDLIRSQETPGVQPFVRPGPVPGTTILDPGAASALFPEARPRAAAAAMAAMSPQSNKAQTDKAIIGPGLMRVPRAYVLCEHDLVVTPALQRRMLAATPCDGVFPLQTGHVPQLTEPAALSGILLGLAAA